MKRIASVLMMALLLAPTGSALANKPEWSRTTEPKRLVEVPDPPRRGPYRPHPEPQRDLRVDVWVDGGDDATYFVGETVTLHFRANRDAYVLLYDIDTEGEVHRLYPRSRWDEQMVEGGVIYTVPNVRAGYRLVASGPEGYEYVGAVASDRPLVNRWDRGPGRSIGGLSYDRLGPTSAPTWRIDSEPELAMDRLYSRLVEVPVEERDGWPQTARDEVRFYIAHSFGWRGR